MARSHISFWVSHTLRYISFRPATGFEPMEVDTYSEMWELIYEYVEHGYRVQ